MSIGEPSGISVETPRSPVWALGLMSGTSLDGIDLALLRTDGAAVIERGETATEPYADELRDALRGTLGGKGDVAAVEKMLTLAHAAAVERLLAKTPDDQWPAIIGFHGHTILHRPDERRTWQIGDGQLLAHKTGCRVVADLRANDVAHGGQGAPLAPLYHAAIGRDLPRPFAVLNIGGVANVTWVGGDEDPLLAFDAGPGGAQLDEWAEKTTVNRFDRDGALARSGTPDARIVHELLSQPYFAKPAPKSLDRIDFSIAAVESLSPGDGAATLLEFTCQAIARGAAHFPAPPIRWLVTGGGRKNGFMLERLGALVNAPVEPIESIGWDGDSLEAEAFAFLAVRSLYRLPITLPGTTGVQHPLTGGRLFHPA